MEPRSIRLDRETLTLGELAAERADAGSFSAWARERLRRDALRELAGEPRRSPKEQFEREEQRLAHEGVTARTGT